MLKHNTYFDGKVQSVGFERNGRRATVGVIAPGSFHFGTEAPERMTIISGALSVKPDGSNDWALYPADGGGNPRPVPGTRPGEEVIGFDEKGQNLNVYSGDLKMRIERLDLSTGKRTFVREVTPADATGVTRISTLQMTPDGRAYCYSFMRSLSRLYMVDGLR